MNPEILTFIIIGITALISWKGFNDPVFFSKYKFNPVAIEDHKQYIRMITSGFLHADMGHLFFNMFTLYFFGSYLDFLVGSKMYILIFILSIILGNVVSLYFHRGEAYYNAVGASGGVSGVLFACIALDPNLPLNIMFIPIDIKGYIFGLFYFAYTIWGMQSRRDNIGHEAHLGGALTGMVFAFLFNSELFMDNLKEIGIMSLPLLYFGYLLVQKK